MKRKPDDFDRQLSYATNALFLFFPSLFFTAEDKP